MCESMCGECVRVCVWGGVWEHVGSVWERV